MGTPIARSHLRGPHAPWRSALRASLPPIDRREFWAVQALVLGIAAIHAWLELQHLLDEHSPIYLFPTTLYLIPIVYAAVNFGLRGSVLTALWSAALITPNILFWHEGLERVGEIAQVTWITVAAVFVGSRVDRERAARLEAEGREAARRASEERYRAIVDNVEEPIILMDEGLRVVEANAAAARVLGRAVSELRGRRLPGTVGAQILATLEAETPGGGPGSRVRMGDPPRWFELVSMAVTGPDGSSGSQLLLRDVTASHEREQGLESITRQTLATREEEQRRIARELHDGPLQSLVQLWRGLDALAAEASGAQADRLVEARRTAETVADELRRFSRHLRPSVLDDLGIVAAVRSEAEALGHRSGIRVHVRVTGEARRFDPQVELALLRISQEALRNVERHSGASTVTIRLAFASHRLRLTILDDGAGLRPIPTASQLLGADHMGLIGMQERARLVGAELTLVSPARGGLRVQVEAPCET